MRCPSCGNENREDAKFCDSCGTRIEAGGPADLTVEPAEGAAPGDPASIGPYRVTGFLGQGGRKRVYLAKAPDGEDQVAVATFDTEGVGAAVSARARREAQAMRKLGDHPHVVRVLDTGEDDGNPYIVSEHMPGGDVEALLSSSGGRLPVERAVEIAVDVCRALEHAHAKAIVHRDLKPANIWLDEAGRARLGDFGLATTEGSSRVSGGTLVGTVAYLPPEQALGTNAGPTSDLYSLGALFYEMLTGQPPFPGDEAVAIISQHLHATPVPPSRHNETVPERLDRLVLDLLRKSPDERPQSAAEVRERLEVVLEPDVDDEDADADAGAENPLDSLAGGIFVGREREFATMRGSVDAALSGHGNLLLVVGEPGIGKTRASEELATYARVRGARVHWGRCREDEGAPAYWPWVQALRSYIRDADPVALAWQMGAGAKEIAQLVPEVAEGSGAPEPAADTEEARFRLFDSVTTFLTAASRDRPLVLVLDDLHWADEPTLLLLRFAAHELADSGLLIVGTYRDVELGRHHPLARVLGELEGERLDLHGLSVPDIERYIEMTAGGPAPPGLAEAVRAQTEGNPFFVGEVVRLLASEGRLGADGASGAGEAAGWDPAIPQGVREVIGRRLDRLSSETNQALQVAAAVGREFSAEVVLRVAELTREQLLAASREAVGERLITSLGPGRFSFSHALVRDTLYEELSPARRAELHESIGCVLEELHGADGDAIGELAHHFLASARRGDADRAIGYAVRAAERAMGQLAYEEAAGLYRRAIELIDSGEPGGAARLVELRLALGAADTRGGRFVEARNVFEEAAAGARELGDSDSLAGAVMGIALLAAVGRVDQPLIDLINEALEAVGPEPTSQRAAMLAALSQQLYWIDPQGLGAPKTQEAIQMAREVGDPMVLASALRLWIFVPWGPAARVERMGAANELLELGASIPDNEVLLQAHGYRLREYLEVGDLAAVDRDLAAFARLAEELRMPHHAWHVPAFRAMRAIVDGDLESAERIAEQAHAAGVRAEQPVASQFYGIQMITIRRLQGRSGELIDVVRKLAEEFPAIPAWRTVLTALLALSGSTDEARADLRRFAADDFAAVPKDLQWLSAMTLLGEVAAIVEDREIARSLYSELMPYAGRMIVVGRAAASNGPVSRVLGDLARTLGRGADAHAHYERALEEATRMGDRPSVARAKVEVARMLLQRGRGDDREQALELLGTALEASREMGTRFVADEALRLRLEAQGLTGVDVTTSIDDVVEALESERPDLLAHAAPDGTVAILFSDIEDSTIMTERLGDERWLEVLRAHNQVFRERIAGYGGFEVKSQGDGFMLAFPDPCEALDCAISVQREFAQREREGGDESLRVRMGLHTGEVIAEDGDFFGKNVILAARIAAQATGSEILVSEQMRQVADEHTDEYDGEPGFRFDEGRELELKGLAGSHRVFRAVWEAKATA